MKAWHNVAEPRERILFLLERTFRHQVNSAVTVNQKNQGLLTTQGGLFYCEKTRNVMTAEN